MSKVHVQISFTKEANLDNVKKQLITLKEQHPEYRFHHCFLSRKQVEEKGLSTDIVDMLDDIIGNVQYAHLDHYETFEEAMTHIEYRRSLVADLVSYMFVLDSGAAEGVRAEVELFTNKKVVLLP